MAINEPLGGYGVFEVDGVEDGAGVAAVVAVGAGVAAGVAVDSEVDEPESELGVVAAGVVLAEPPRLSVL